MQASWHACLSTAWWCQAEEADAVKLQRCQSYGLMCVLLCADDPKEQIAENLFGRSQDFKARRGSQIQTVEFPTTTIGSFPQTAGAPRPSKSPCSQLLDA